MHSFEDAYRQYLEEEPVDGVNFQAQRKWMAKYGFQAEGKVLDVGCGSGKWVRFLRKSNCEAYGLEPCQALYQSYLKDSPWFFPGEVVSAIPGVQTKYQAVTCFDVLEHVAEPLAFLERMADLLDEDGRLYLSTPDVGSSLARSLGKRWHHFCAYHLSLFSPKTIAIAARQAGLVVEHCSHRGRYRSIGYTLRYASEFLLGVGRCNPGARWDRRSWYLNLGDSMYCVLRRATAVPATQSRAA